jgi:hypothetical protein
MKSALRAFLTAFVVAVFIAMLVGRTVSYASHEHRDPPRHGHHDYGHDHGGHRHTHEHSGRHSHSDFADGVIGGIIIGAVAGYFGGRIDMIISRAIEIVMLFPSLFLILTIVALIGPSIYIIMVVIGLTSWPTIARLTRGEFLRQREIDYVAAARALPAAGAPRQTQGLPLRDALGQAPDADRRGHHRHHPARRGAQQREGLGGARWRALPLRHRRHR